MPDRFLIVDDHPLFRDALRSAIEVGFPAAEIVETNAIAAALAVLTENAGFDLVLLDLSMPGVTGFDGLLSIRSVHPRLPIVIVSGLEDPRIVSQSLACGVSGFIPKSVRKSELILAIRLVMTGSIYVPSWHAATDQPTPPAARDDDLIRRLMSLTPRQRRVLDLICRGKLNKQIAFELQVGETTAKAHVSEILRKLNVRSRTMAVTEVARIDLPGLDLKTFFLESGAPAMADRTGPGRPDDGLLRDR